MNSRPHFGVEWQVRFWPTLLAGVLTIKAVLSVALSPTFILVAYGVVVYFLLLLLATVFALRNAAQRTLGSRIFWIFMAGGCGLWAFDQWLNVYYGIVLRADAVPDSSIADPALFLHIVPLMAAVAMQPHLHRLDQRLSRASLNFLLLLFCWVFLYAYILFPYQYLFADAAIYNPRFTALYALENLALVLALGIVTFRAQMPWSSVYVHFFGASALYGVSSTLANIAIDSGWQYNGSIYSFAQVAAVCWFVWVPLHARQLPLAEAMPTEPDVGRGGFSALMAKMAVIAIPLIGMWELLKSHDSPGMRTFRLSVVLAAILFLAMAVFLREYLLRRDLLLESRVSKLQEKLSRAALVNSEDRYRDLVEHSQDLLCTHDLEGKLLSCNPAPARILGYEVAELLKIPMREIVAPEFRERFDQYLTRIKRNGADQGLLCVVTRDGGRRIWEYNNTLRTEDVPSPIVRGMAHDVTERKRAEEALREREEKFHQMADNIQEIFWMVEATTKEAIYVNPAFEQLTGRTVASLLEAPLSYTEIIHPDDRLRVMKSLDEAERNGVLNEEFRIVRLDGTIRWVEARGFPIRDALGKVYRLVGVVQDITERKRAEEVLRESEERFRLAAQAGKMFAYEWDAATDVIVRSAESAQILGIEESAQITGQQVLTKVHPDDRERLRAAIGALSPETPYLQISYRMVRPDGTLIWVDRSSRAHFDKQGRMLRIVGMVADITERKRAEEVLRESEDRYRDLVEHSQDLLCTHDLEGKLLSCNPAPARILGYGVAELLKIPLQEIIAPEFREQFDQYLTRITKKGADKGLMCVMTRSGEHRIWEYDNTLRVEGVPSPIVRGMAHDVTERMLAEKELRRREEDYRMFVAQSSEGIFRQDLDAPLPIDLPEDELVRHILYDSYQAECNDAIAKMYGLNSAKDFIGKRLTDSLDPNDPHNLELTREFVRSGFRVLERESHEVDVHGNPKIFLNSMIGIVEKGKLTRTWGIQRDITERRQTEKALQNAQMELARVTRIATLGELTASIAHEINQPLAAVVTNGSASLRWLDASPPNLNEAREAMARTIDEANRASEVIEKIRMLLQKSSPHLERLDVNDVIREVLALTGPELQRSEVTVCTELAATVPTVLGDRVQLQQVVLNLVANAVEAMSTVVDRPRTLLIRSAKDGEVVVIQVQDSGTGLKPEEMDRIFDPFFTTKPQGIGMGLSIGRSIVEAHGGSLWVSPGPSHGTVFQFTLPAEKASDEAAA